MKKILVLPMLIVLCSCTLHEDEVVKSARDEEETIETREHFDELSAYSNYIDDNYDEYVLYYGDFDDDKLIDLVNNDILNSDNCDKLINLYSNEYYVDRLEDLYLKYLNDYDDVRELIEIVNTNRYEPLYTDIKDTDTSKDYKMLINKYHKLTREYEPEDLVEIDSNYGRGSTRSAVYDAFVKMADDAYEEGYVITVTSAYRSYDYQDGLYNKYLNEENGDQEKVDTYSARPGHSEHQSGLCLDIVTPGYSMDDFGLSDASKWVNENCYKYGFIIRYTGEKENITGYQAEAWQVRYIGDTEASKYIRDTGITYDEYYTCFVE